MPPSSIRSLTPRSQSLSDLRAEYSLLKGVPLNPNNAPAPRDYYRAREALARTDAERFERRLLWLGRFRIVVFLVAAVPLLLLETAPRDTWPVLISGGSAAGLLFLVLVVRYRGTKREVGRARLRKTLNTEGLARLDRNWDALPPAPVLAVPRDHPSAEDLDLVGRASLSHLIGRVKTAAGGSVLQQLLLDPFARLPTDAADLLLRIGSEPPRPVPTPGSTWPAALRERQEAVKVLAEAPEMREDIELSAREAPRGGSAHDTRRFLAWLAQPRWLAEHRVHLYAARVLAIFTPVTAVAWLLGLTPGVLPILGALAAYALHWAVGPSVVRRFSDAEAGEGDLKTWSSHMALAAQLPEGSVLLDRFRASVREPAPGGARAIERLIRIMDTASVRRSALFHFPLVCLFAWDVHVLDRLERWHAKHAAAAVGWIDTVGELEVLAAFGGLLHDHRDWVFPEFLAESRAGISASGLGHPLLHPMRCVRNDVELAPPGRLLLVTGSNMAGKTTLLRAIGVNQVLALAGGPVAADRMQTKAILPWCTMRVRDSLEGGVSYFLAELQRLKQVVDAAQAGPVLFLLDEVLQGTNSAERRTAARIVLSQLLETAATGAVTTHDLELGVTPELENRVVDVHFREQVVEVDGARTLRFDYLLRPGLATSRNALLLLEIAGLGPGKRAP
jgi:hypothetical protein